MSGLRASTLVKTSTELIPISDIKSNEHVYNNLNKQVRVTRNLVTDNVDNFILIKQNALGKNMPEHDIYIMKNNVIIINGIDIIIDKLINGISIININLEKPESVYHLCTENKTFISVENIFINSTQHN